ncbi:MAG: hypothetical protein PHN56_05425 [Candidatus Nanoarchaeia archaeon]|nr:hypothetical protein [Candidatus Nanoarchaeia archaeon]
MNLGNNFYIQAPENQFIEKVDSWLSFLKIRDLFPNLSLLKDKIFELGENLRKAGDSSYLGITDGINYSFIRPGDYSTLLHELTHNNNNLKSEACARAIEIYTAGDFDGVLSGLHSNRYSSDEKRKGTLISEASLVVGKKIFNFLEKEGNLNYTNLAIKIKEFINKCNQEYINSNMDETDYLIKYHSLTEKIAYDLLITTEDNRESIFNSTSNIKKQVIGAFKSLTSFYHINLNYTLEDAIKKTEYHFENDEALTLHKTLNNGAKNVFAKMKEYNYPLELCRKISEEVLNHGASKSIDYSRGLPYFLEILGGYGPKGVKILRDYLEKESLFNLMTLTDISESLVYLNTVEPEQVGFLLNEFNNFNWNLNWDKDIEKSNILNLKIPGSYNNKIMHGLSQIEKAKFIALYVYTTIIPNIGKKLKDYDSSLEYLSCSNQNLFILKTSIDKKNNVLDSLEKIKQIINQKNLEEENEKKLKIK